MQIDIDMQRDPVLIASPHATLAEALATCLSASFGISAQPVTSAPDLQRLMESRRRAPLVLMDAAFGEDGDFVDSVASILPVAVLSDQPSLETSARVLDGRLRGALTKTTPLRTVAAAIRLMLGGDTYLRELAPPMGTQPRLEDGKAGLSDRKRAIGERVAAGWSNRQIEAELNLSASIVAAEVRAMLRQFGVRNRTELAMRWNGA